MGDAESLRRRIREREEELERLKEDLRQAEAAEQKNGHYQRSDDEKTEQAAWKWPLSVEDYERYARQLIISQVGVPGELPNLGLYLSTLITSCKANSGSKKLRCSSWVPAA